MKQCNRYKQTIESCMPSTKRDLIVVSHIQNCNECYDEVLKDEAQHMKNNATCVKIILGISVVMLITMYYFR